MSIESRSNVGVAVLSLGIDGQGMTDPKRATEASVSKAGECKKDDDQLKCAKRLERKRNTAQSGRVSKRTKLRRTVELKRTMDSKRTTKQI